MSKTSSLKNIKIFTKPNFYKCNECTWIKCVYYFLMKNLNNNCTRTDNLMKHLTQQAHTVFFGFVGLFIMFRAFWSEHDRTSKAPSQKTDQTCNQYSYTLKKCKTIFKTIFHLLKHKWCWFAHLPHPLSVLVCK